MSTPEQVAARPDWADTKAREIAESISAHTDQGDASRVHRLTDGMTYSIATALREAKAEALASQRAAIERLEGEATGAKELLALFVEALDWHGRGCDECRPLITKVRAALSTTGATTGADRGNG